jgi:hypothetical protein
MKPGFIKKGVSRPTNNGRRGAPSRRLFGLAHRPTAGDAPGSDKGAPRRGLAGLAMAEKMNTAAPEPKAGGGRPVSPGRVSALLRFRKGGNRAGSE